jgi:hypothetical protein
MATKPPTPKISGELVPDPHEAEFRAMMPEGREARLQRLAEIARTADEPEARFDAACLLIDLGFVAKPRGWHNDPINALIEDMARAHYGACLEALRALAAGDGEIAERSREALCDRGLT